MFKKRIILPVVISMVVLVIIFSLLFSMNSREKTYPYHEQLRDMVAFRIKFFDISEQCDKDFKKTIDYLDHQKHKESIPFPSEAEKSCFEAYQNYKNLEVPKSLSKENRKIIKKEIEYQKKLRKTMYLTTKDTKKMIESNFNPIVSIPVLLVNYSRYKKLNDNRVDTQFIQIYINLLKEPCDKNYIPQTPFESYTMFVKKIYEIKSECLEYTIKTEKLLDKNNLTEALKTAQKAEQSCLKASQNYAKLNADDKIPEEERKLLKKASDKLSGIYLLKYEYTKDLQTAAKTNSKDFRKKDKTKSPKYNNVILYSFDIIDEAGKRLILQDEK